MRSRTEKRPTKISVEQQAFAGDEGFVVLEDLGEQGMIGAEGAKGLDQVSVGLRCRLDLVRLAHGAEPLAIGERGLVAGQADQEGRAGRMLPIGDGTEMPLHLVVVEAATTVLRFKVDEHRRLGDRRIWNALEPALLLGELPVRQSPRCRAGKSVGKRREAVTRGRRGASSAWCCS
jgi:hypothetical protein